MTLPPKREGPQEADQINLWLDDVRPAPTGWLHVKTVEDAKLQLEAGRVKKASLDHDLGACELCMEQWRGGNHDGLMPNCEHFGTGYTLVCWMEETGHWPAEKPSVHSLNPVGREKMRRVIEAKWRPQ